jgi:hypothetical protein
LLTDWLVEVPTGLHFEAVIKWREVRPANSETCVRLD